MKKVKGELEFHRVAINGDKGDANNGAFLMRSPQDGVTMAIIISDWVGWEHVSVSRVDRVPTWDEMCYVKDLVFEDEETVVQYHPAKSKYVDNHPYCLHMWRPLLADLPCPPEYLVGIK